ncbi:MAG: hypothetical protein JSR67_04865 [Proteobacteria bacterium]|nr:hypothetical protein [Pseudomonadota bacterium]
MRRNRLIALLVACALLVCSALYSAHGLADPAHGHSHCDLCVHLGGSAGTTPAAVAADKPAPGVWIRVPAETAAPLARRLGNAYLPRGPPAIPA